LAQLPLPQRQAQAHLSSNGRPIVTLPPEQAFEEILAHLNGYLNALRRIAGHVLFSAVAFPTGNDFETAIKTHVDGWGVGTQYIGCNQIEYDEVKAILRRQIYDRLDGLGANAIAFLDWDIQEYYGLASVALDESDEFHPLVSGPVFRLEIIRDDVADGEYFAVQIGSFAVVTALAQRAA
jgi:hypothetical protein